MDKPMSKKIGAPRFDGRGKNQPKPGSVKWYRQHTPDRLNNTKITIRETGGLDEESAEIVAARILRWNEGPQPHINDSLIKEEIRLFERQTISRYRNEEPPEDFFSFDKSTVDKKTKE